MSEVVSKSVVRSRRSGASARSLWASASLAGRDFLRGLLGKTSRRDPLGPQGEAIAARHLRRKGYRILGKNLRVRVGEADVLAIDPDGTTIVLVEVKSRRVRTNRAAELGEVADAGVRAEVTLAVPPPEASVDQAKRAKLRAVLSCLLTANGWQSRASRIDVVAIEMGEDGPLDVRHHVGVVSRT
jgi:putative endonuclease